MRLAPSTALALLAALALTLASCGGERGTDTSTVAAPSQGATSSQVEAPAQTAAGSQSEPSSPVQLPLPTPGAKAAAPGVPTRPGGDNSIQTYGREGSKAQRAHVSAILQSYLSARVARDWAKVCSLLAAKPRAEQGRFAGGASCAKAMRSFAAGASSALLAEEAEIDVLSFRVGSRYAFVIYRRPDGIFATALTREAGRWKLITVTPTPVE